MTQRTILFRGKRIDNGEFAHGDLLHGVKRKSGKFYILPDNINQPGCDPLDGFEVDPATVGQFTGLTDKNGVNIFEGDIVFRSGHDVKSTIEWVEKYMCFAGKIDGTLYGFYQQIDMPYIEVIGNIHDNPDLI